MLRRVIEELNPYLEDEDRLIPGTDRGIPYPAEDLPSLGAGVPLYDETLAWIKRTWGNYDNMPAEGQRRWFRVLGASRGRYGGTKVKLKQWAQWLFSLTDLPDPIRMTITEVAKYVGVTDRTIRTWLANGKLRAIEGADGRWLFSKSSLHMLRESR